jgi:hypothetical protein
MTNTIADMEMLAICDFVMVTYSSNWGRRIFEMMYNNYVDAAQRIISLDRKYHYFFPTKETWKIVFKHDAGSRFPAFEVGNVVNLGTSSFCRDGLLHISKNNFPSTVIPEFKVEQDFQGLPTPTYDE